MSQQELEQGDQEVMGVVNGHSHPEAEAAAEKIAETVCQPVVEDPDPEECCGECSRAEKLYRKHKQQEKVFTVFFVAVCLLIAAALVAAWYLPGLLIWVINFGVLICGIAAAVKIDKYIRWWR